jgi:hypothetical protein
VERIWGIALVPVAAPLAHGSAGIWDELFNLLAVGIVLVVLGVIVFSRKPASSGGSEEPDPPDAAEQARSGETPPRRARG